MEGRSMSFDAEDDKPLLDYVSEVTELNEMSKHMNDPVIDEAMAFVVKLTVKNNVPAKAVAPLIVKLEALAGQCALKAKYLMVWGKTQPEASQRKGTYLTMEAVLHDLANAVKHLNKTGY
jgi:hypothetical protein